jgi:hypothetical protein
MALFSKSLARCATVRCATRVTARIIIHEQLVEYLMQQPLAKHQVRPAMMLARQPLRQGPASRGVARAASALRQRGLGGPRRVLGFF